MDRVNVSMQADGMTETAETEDQLMAGIVYFASSNNFAWKTR